MQAGLNGRITRSMTERALLPLQRGSQDEEVKNDIPFPSSAGIDIAETHCLQYAPRWNS
jgi:hypothetical protein